MSLTIRTGAFPLALALVACGLPLAAQTQTPPPDCSLPLTGFLIEHPVDLTAIKSTATQTIPADLAAQLATKEIRSRTQFNVATRVLTNDLFLVNKGAPSLTPLTTNILSSRVGYMVVYVDHVDQSCKPSPSVLVAGSIADGATPLGDPTGANFVFTFSFATKPASPNPFANPGFPQFRDIVITSGGSATLYQDRAVGAISFQTSSPKGAPQIVLNLPPGATTIPVASSPYMLDASYSVDPNGGGLQFEWASDKPAAFWPGNFSPVPLVTFSSGSGDYNITLTVTNNAGLKSVSKFKLSYSPK
jgi:hypothetical protein